MSNVQVTRKQLSNGLQAVLLNIDGQDGMTVPEVVRVLGIHERTISSHMKSAGFEFARNLAEIRKELVEQRVIPLGAGRTPRFIPREAIESLVRFISTPETDAIYAELWGVARAVQSGDIERAQELTSDDSLSPVDRLMQTARRTSGDLLTLVEALDAERKARLQAEESLATQSARVLSLVTNAADAALEHAIVSRTIKDQCPHIRHEAAKYWQHTKTRVERWKFSNESARITIYLKEVWDLVAKVNERLPNHPKVPECERAMFNANDINRIEKTLSDAAHTTALEQAITPSLEGN